MSNNVKKVLEIKRLDIVVLDLPDLGGSIQHGLRTCLVIQNDVGNKYSPTCLIVPFTSKLTKNNLPTHVFIKKTKENLLRDDSVLLFEQIMTVEKKKIIQVISNLKTNLYDIDNAIEISLGLRIR